MDDSTGDNSPTGHVKSIIEAIMLLLTVTTQTLELTTTSAANIDFTVDYVEHSATAFTPGSNQGTIAAATTTTILTAPASATQRQVKEITIRNRHASLANTIAVIRDVSGANYLATSAIILDAGETAYWSESVGWIIYLATGLVKLATAASSVAWGGITGTLANQTDLQQELDRAAQLSMAS